MSTPLRIAYFGSGRFAVMPLEALFGHPHDFKVVAVVHQPDRPVGRQGKPEACPVGQAVKAWVAGHQTELRIFQPEKVKGNADFAEALKRLDLDLAVVASYGQILPGDLLAIPRLGFLNLHGSILPRWRGASPIQSAILAGDNTTGVSLMVMDAKMDHGPVLRTVELEIAPHDSYASLESRLSRLAADLAVVGVREFASGALQAREQDHGQATFCKILKRDDGLIDWKNEDAVRIERKLRAFTPWPGIFTVWDDGGKRRRIKLLRLHVAHGIKPQHHTPGTVTETEDGLPAVTAADGGIVVLEECQMEGKKAGSGKSTLCGYRKLIGTVLESDQPSTS